MKLSIKLLLSVLTVTAAHSLIAMDGPPAISAEEAEQERALLEAERAAAYKKIYQDYAVHEESR